MNKQAIFPSIDKPWMKHYGEQCRSLTVPNASIYDEFSRVAFTHPDHIAIDYLGTQITYSELKERIDSTARAFSALGVRSGDRVSLVTANTPENVVALYALNKLGAVANMVDLTLKGSDLVDKINGASSKVVVATDVFLDSLRAVEREISAAHVIITTPVDSLPLWKRAAYRVKAGRPRLFDKCMLWSDFVKVGLRNAKGADALPRICDPASQSACICYTSGTTGKSKGCVLTNGNLVAMVQEYANCGLEFAAGDRMFNENPPFISYCAVLGINLPLALGMCIVMFPTYEPDHFAERVYRAKPQHILACPADWSNFFVDGKAKARDYSFMSTLASGGVAFNAKTKAELNSLLASLGCRNPIVEGYGMTEGSSAMCTAVPAYNVAGTVGVPLPLMSACIWDGEAGKELGFGQVGEICFSGPTVMAGYLEDEAATREALRRHPDGELWLHTGDLGLIREDGGVEVVGRIKRLIIRYDGFKISPFDIETHIRKCDGVSDCCVVAMDDTEHGFGSVPAAFVVVEGGADAETVMASVRTACEEALPERNAPRAYFVVERLPLTKVGKVDYRKLEAMAAEGECS